uniref:Uncharacterized protein n=1 Tax=viral metagenome TaxID=1070528 RepID=A0A6C0KZE9_9ZZZZ|tara:strand:+ start:3358 stop:4203 length:846 start_codon:yes stop_codon:yes gene_type:complete
MAEHIDLLDEDKPIAEQKFVCLSFVSPEKILKDKNLFFFEKFVEQYNFNKQAELLTKYSNYITYKYELNTEDVMNDLKDFSTIETDSMYENVADDFKNFMDRNEEKYEAQFNKENEFQTSVRGMKVRGVFPTQEEAEMRCKMLRQIDPNHDVYVGPVGLWVPFHPEAYKTGRVEYLEKELNQLMHEKNKNEEQAKLQFDTRVKESKLNAISENIEEAKKHGNKLTQTINEAGELVGTDEGNTVEKKLGVNASMEEIQKELFEGDNIVTSMTDHGLSEITKN